MFGHIFTRQTKAIDLGAMKNKNQEEISMFGTTISRFSRQLRTRTSRIAVQAATMLAIAGMVFSAAPQAAEASPNANDHAYRLNFTRLESVNESGEAGSDEPYVLFFVGNLSNPIGGSFVRSTDTFSGVDTGEDRYQTVRLWGSASAGAVMPGHNPDNLIVLAQIMESDNSSKSAIISKLQQELPTQLALYKAGGLSRSQIVNALKGDMFDYIGSVAESTDGWTDNADERVGGVQELRITAANLQAAHTGTTISKTIQVNDGSDGSYRMYFELRRA